MDDQENDIFFNLFFLKKSEVWILMNVFGSAGRARNLQQCIQSSR